MSIHVDDTTVGLLRLDDGLRLHDSSRLGLVVAEIGLDVVGKGGEDHRVFEVASKDGGVSERRTDRRRREDGRGLEGKGLGGRGRVGLGHDDGDNDAYLGGLSDAGKMSTTLCEVLIAKHRVHDSTCMHSMSKMAPEVYLKERLHPGAFASASALCLSVGRAIQKMAGK